MPIVYDVLKNLSDIDIGNIRKPDIIGYYGLKESTSVSDRDVVNILTESFNKIPKVSDIRYRPEMIPVVMKEADGDIGYFIEYNDLRKFATSVSLSISDAFYAICEHNSINYDDACVYFYDNFQQEVSSLKEETLQSNNLHCKLFNKSALSSFYDDIMDLKESEIMLFKKSEE